MVMMLAFSLVACNNQPANNEGGNAGGNNAGENNAGGTDTAKEAAITLWTYPVGQWQDSAVVDGLIAEFNKVYPNIKVSVEYLDYANGDDQVNSAIEGNKAPDLILEGPERLVANWGAKGLMVDLADLWTDADKSDIYESVQKACFNPEGACYEFPLCMTAHTMAINYDLFKEAGALQYLDEETRTWTTDGYEKAIQAVYDHVQENVTAVFCNGQGGDQGTRALINNLYSGTFANAEHTQYTANTPENIKALELLKGMKGVNFDASLNGGDEINLFCNGTLAVANCWNVGAEKANADKLGFDAFPMAFPSDDGKPELCGGIWGFGIFNNGDQAKIDAAKTFIKYICTEAPAANVKASTFWSVRKSLENIYEGDALMTEYGKFMPYMGDYYQVTKGWAEARTAWWNMLQKIGTGTPVSDAVAEFDATANGAAQ